MKIVSIENEVVTKWLKIREVTTSLLPIGHSFIPFDIILKVLDFYNNNKKLTVKNLFVDLPYSDMGLRYHFNRLVQSGWLVLVKSESDARIREIKPSEKLISIFSVIVNKIE